MSYPFLGGPISMVDVVNYANTHGMYFSNRPLPRLSRSRTSRSQGVFSVLTPPDFTIGMDAEASISSAPGISQWIEQSKEISYVVTATAWGYITASSLHQGGARYSLVLDLYLGNTLLARTGQTWPNSPEGHGMQNDSGSNNRSSLHMQYALSYAGMRNAASATESFRARFTLRMDEDDVFTINTEYSEAHVEIGLFDVVGDTIGLT